MTSPAGLSGVSKTAILTLRARADEHAREDRIFADPIAAEWFSRMQWPSEELDAWYGPDAQRNLAFRADDIDEIARRYHATHPATCAIELGCGLSTRRDRLGTAAPPRWLDVDLPEVAALRRSWGIEHEQVGSSVLDYAWMDNVTGPSDSNLFIAEGLFYYLPRAQVDLLLAKMRQRFAGSALILDVIGENDYDKLLQNTTRVGSPIQWKLTPPYDNVLEDFGLQTLEEFEPVRLNDDALHRYWDLFDAKLQAAIYFAWHTPAFWAGRSGTVLGRL